MRSSAACRRPGRRSARSPEFDYVIVNEDLETAVEELRSIIRAEWCRPGVRTERIDAILRSFSGEERP